jgi:hypothetical protein
MEHEKEHGQGRLKYQYFVDGVKYETEQSTVTGAYIIALIPGFEEGYSLYEEGKGNDPDQLITEASTLTLAHGTPHLYTVPPATFGDHK